MPAPPQPRRHRLRRAAKWSGLALTLLLIATWALRGMRQVAHVNLTPSSWFDLAAGDATLTYWSHGPAAGYRLALKPTDVVADLLNEIAIGSQPGRWHWSLPHVRYHQDSLDTYAEILLPIWCMLIPSTLATAFLWHRDRRRPPGLCPSCNYPLSGLPPNSPCPECGKGATA